MRNKERRFKLHNLMFLYIITTVIVTIISFSKYVTTIATDKKAVIAIMANDISSIDIDLPQEAYPGLEVVYPIVITNKKDDRICDVTQEFTLEIEREENENIPLEFALYKDEFCTEVMSKDENGYYISDDFQLVAGEEDSRTYYLKITWPEEENEEYLAFEIGYFSVTIVSTQVD